ncbi:MAG: hypothetical protein Q7K35_03570 [bacterium]|nr:hypothetical protein [bacterium]
MKKQLFLPSTNRVEGARLERYYVPVDYDARQAIAMAIAGNKFGGRYIGLPLRIIPLVGSGRFEREVYRVGFKCQMLNRDLPLALKELGVKLRFSDPLTVLRFVYFNPDKYHTLVAQFTDTRGRLRTLCVSRIGQWRYIVIRTPNPNGFWHAGVDYLVERGPPPGA